MKRFPQGGSYVNEKRYAVQALHKNGFEKSILHDLSFASKS